MRNEIRDDVLKQILKPLFFQFCIHYTFTEHIRSEKIEYYICRKQIQYAYNVLIHKFEYDSCFNEKIKIIQLFVL